MSVAAHPKRPSTASRRAGYALASGINLLLLYLVNVAPGWEVLPFLTDETPQVLGLVNASLLVSLVANLVYVVHDPAWLRALGDLATTAVGLAAMVRIWQVFPFAFDDAGIPWETVARVLLVIGMVGSAIGIVAAVVRLVAGLAERGPSSATHHE